MRHWVVESKVILSQDVFRHFYQDPLLGRHVGSIQLLLTPVAVHMDV